MRKRYVRKRETQKKETNEGVRERDKERCKRTRLREV
jgi:hypothetical protein